MFFRDCLRDGKAQSIMMNIAVSSLIHSIEAIKKMFQHIRFDGFAFIGDTQDRSVRLSLQREGDLFPGRMADCIVQQDRY